MPGVFIAILLLSFSISLLAFEPSEREGEQYGRTAFTVAQQHIASNRPAALRFIDLATRMFENVHEARMLKLCREQKAVYLDPVKAPPVNWAEAVAAYEAEIAALSKTGDKLERARLYCRLGWCLQPDNNAAGNWTVSIIAFHNAADLSASADDKFMEGIALLNQGYCTSYKSPVANAGDAIELFERAGVRFNETGSAIFEAMCLSNRASNLLSLNGSKRERNLSVSLAEQSIEMTEKMGDPTFRPKRVELLAYCLMSLQDDSEKWSKAESALEKAYGLYHEIGDKIDQGNCRYHQGDCQLPTNNPQGSWEKAMDYYERAAELHHSAGALKFEESDMLSRACCLIPTSNPSGSWSAASTHFEKAAALAEANGDIFEQAMAINWVAYCEIQGDRKRMIPKARALFEKSASLLRAAKHEDRARNVERWLK